jgi:hypothetical protein
VSSVQIPEDVATLAGGPEPIGPPGQPPMAPPGPPGMGGPPPDAGGGGIPPELAAMLGGGGGPGGPPPPGGPEGGGEPSEVDQLSTVLDGLMQYLQIASDDVEKAKAMQAAKIIQDLLASNQQEAEAAGGIGPAQRGMRKALGG